MGERGNGGGEEHRRQLKRKKPPLPAGSHPRNEGGEPGGEGEGGEVPGYFGPDFVEVDSYGKGTLD